MNEDIFRADDCKCYWQILKECKYSQNHRERTLGGLFKLL